jgi:hypothetical protein
MRKAGVCLVAVFGVWLVAATAVAATANQIKITVSSDPTVGATYNVTLRGTSRGPANAWLFIEYSGCAKSFAAERRLAPKKSFVRYRVNGSFVRVSGWASNSAVLDHACAYVVANGSSTTLARSRISFRIHR